MADKGRGLGAWLKLLLLLADEIAVVVVVPLLLWKFGIHLHVGVLAGVAIVLGITVFLLYRALLPVLSDKQTYRQGMVGLEGEVIRPLRPEGVIRVRGELWQALATDRDAVVGQTVVITEVKGLKLLVKHKNRDQADQG